jgi:hypothetical protein
MSRTPRTRRMDPADKAAWIDALRSGIYFQGQDYLVQGRLDPGTGWKSKRLTYCCLGVLCVTHKLEILTDDDFHSVRGFHIPTELRSSRPMRTSMASVLPESVRTAWSLPDGNLLPDGLFEPLDLGSFGQPVALNPAPLHETFVSLNDTGFTFNQIADVIAWSEEI